MVQDMTVAGWSSLGSFKYRCLFPINLALDLEYYPGPYLNIFGETKITCSLLRDKTSPFFSNILLNILRVLLIILKKISNVGHFLSRLFSICTKYWITCYMLYLHLKFFFFFFPFYVINLFGLLDVRRRVYSWI